MEFIVLKRSDSGNLLLEASGRASDKRKPVKTRTGLYKRGKKVAVLKETIGLVEKPLYLAEPKTSVKQGETLSTKKRAN